MFFGCSLLASVLCALVLSTPPLAPFQNTKRTVKEEILTARTWVVKEAVDLQNGTLSRYARGANGNTTDLDGDELAFYANHEGEYKDATGATYRLKWRFTNDEQTQMDVLVDYPLPVTLRYEMIHLAANDFTATHSYVNGNGSRVLASFHRIYKTECDDKSGNAVLPL